MSRSVKWLCTALCALLLLTLGAYALAENDASPSSPEFGFIADAAQNQVVETESEPLRVEFNLSTPEMLAAGGCQAAISVENRLEETVSEVTISDARANVLWGPHDMKPGESYVWRGTLEAGEEEFSAGLIECRVS